MTQSVTEEPKYRRVSLKKALIDEVEQTIQECPYWRSIAEFVSEAIRLRLEHVKKSERDARRVA